MTNTTNNSKIAEIKARVSELQKRVGRQLQVTIYKDSLNTADDFKKAASDCRMSVLDTGYTPGKKEDNPSYAVRVVAEGIGEIPYPLLCHEIYLEGESSQGGD
jgi:hypothetical protein